MKDKIRNFLITKTTKTINKIFKIYWFITRPTTQGVKALVFNKSKILMVRLTYYPNTWTFPGGKVARNEKPEEAVIRECEEEVGIKLKKPKFLKTLKFNHEYKKDTVFIYREDVKNSDFNIDRIEVVEAGWFDLNELPNMGKNAKRILEVIENL